MGNGFISRLVANRDGTARAIRDAMVERVPAYAVLPSARHAALLNEVQDTWSPVLRQAGAGEPLGESDLEPYRALGRQRALESFPLDDLMTGFAVAHTAGLRECLATMEAGDKEEPMAFVTWGVREQPRVMGAVAEAYKAARIRMGDRVQARETLVDCLTKGAPAEAEAAAYGITLPTGYLALACQSPFSERLSLGIRQGTVGRVLESVPDLLWRENSLTGRLLLLFPVTEDVAPVRETAADLTVALSEFLGKPLHTAEAYGATLGAVPRAVHEAQQTTNLVAAMPDSRSRPYRADELLVELAVARQPDILERLVGLLAPLRKGTDLRRTLEVLYDCGLDRERAAKALYVHRRTLTYRIQRIRELTGLDPTSAHGIQLLRVALTAARLRAGAAASADTVTPADVLRPW